MKKRIPYGIGDFETIRKENYYYVDKTKIIQELEKHQYPFFHIQNYHSCLQRPGGDFQGMKFSLSFFANRTEVDTKHQTQTFR